MPSPEAVKPMVGTTVMVAPKHLGGFAEACLEKLGFPPEDASILADRWVWAARRGKPTHSVIRLVQVAAAVREARVKPKVDWSPVRQRGGTTLLDARDGYGVIAGARGMRLAVKGARQHGSGVTVIRNCDNTGALGMFPGIAIAEGMIGMAITNSNPIMGGWGGARPLIGNQAWSMGAPAGKNPPLLLDMHLAAGSLGTRRESAASGTPMPPGIAADSRGVPTTDGKAALDGFMLPMAGYGGWGIAVMWELLTGVLSGGMFLEDVGAHGKPQSERVSLFTMALDPTAFMSAAEFDARVDELIDRIHASPTAPGFDHVRVPGETGGEHWNRHEQTVPVAQADLDRLKPLAAELGVALPLG